MREKDVEKQFQTLQQEIDTNAEAFEGLRRDQRAAVDTLRLEIEVLRRCIERLHPGFRKCLDTTWAEVVQEIDPEAL